MLASGSGRAPWLLSADGWSASHGTGPGDRRSSLKPNLRRKAMAGPRWPEAAAVANHHHLLLLLMFLLLPGAIRVSLRVLFLSRPRVVKAGVNGAEGRSAGSPTCGAPD